MTTEEHDFAIRVYFHNGDKILKETELQDTIGKKMPKLVKPQNEALTHTSAEFLKAYAAEGFPEICGLDRSIYHIESSLPCGPHPSENLSAATAALHTEPSEKTKIDTLRFCGMGKLRGTPQKISRYPQSQ